MTTKSQYKVDSSFFSFDEKKAHTIKIKVVDRVTWGAAPPSRPPEPQAKLATSLVVHYDSGIEPCHNDEECEKAVRELQRRHMEQGLPDIAYNFLVGGHGTLYEGTGWDHKSWQLDDKYAHLDGTCYDVAYIGRFSLDKRPYPFMPRACLNWMNHAVHSHRIDPYFKLIENTPPPEYAPAIEEPYEY